MKNGNVFRFDGCFNFEMTFETRDRHFFASSAPFSRWEIAGLSRLSEALKLFYLKCENVELDSWRASLVSKFKSGELSASIPDFSLSKNGNPMKHESLEMSRKTRRKAEINFRQSVK